MKKQKYLLLTMILTCALFGCAQAEVPATEEETVVEDTTVEETAEAEESEEEKEPITVPTAEETQDVSLPDVADEKNGDVMPSTGAVTLPSEDTMKDMIGGMTDYLGLILIESRYDTFYTLSNEQIFSLAGSIAVSNYPQSMGDSNDGYGMFSKEIYDEIVKDFFVSQFADSYNGANGDMWTKKTEDGFGVMLGDWGLCYPRFDLISIKEDRGKIVVVADYYAFDDEMGERTDSFGTATLTLYMEPSDVSQYGYVISDMSFERAE